MLVLIVIAAVVVVAAVVFLAMGGGGGISVERNDYFPLDLGPVSATDVAMHRPPTGLWGYNMQATNEALELIAQSIRDRDVRIVALEQLVTDLSRDHAPAPLLGSPYAGARHRRPAEPEPAPEPVADPAPPPMAEPMPGSGPALAPGGEPPTVSAPQFVNIPPAESARLTFGLSTPGGDASGAPPEESHD